MREDRIMSMHIKVYLNLIGCSFSLIIFMRPIYTSSDEIKEDKSTPHTLTPLFLEISVRPQ